MPIRMTTAQARKMGIDPPSKPAKRSKTKKGTSAKDALFLAACASHGLPPPIPEYVFHPTRGWRFDWAYPTAWIQHPTNPTLWKVVECQLALEIDGGVHSGGRHTRGRGFCEDLRKINEAILLGWRVLRVTPAEVKSGEVFELLKRALQVEKPT